MLNKNKNLLSIDSSLGFHSFYGTNVALRIKNNDPALRTTCNLIWKLSMLVRYTVHLLQTGCLVYVCGAKVLFWKVPCPC